MSSSTSPSIALTPLCELQPALPPHATPFQIATAHRDACADSVAEAMGAFRRLFDPAVHVFSDRNHGHDALALQIQIVVSQKMLSAAEKKVRKEGRRRERKWEVKMVAKEEEWKAQLSKMASTARNDAEPAGLLLDKSEKQFVESFSGEMGEEKAKALVERVDKWPAGKGWILFYEDEVAVRSAEGGA